MKCRSMRQRPSLARRLSFSLDSCYLLYDFFHGLYGRFIHSFIHLLPPKTPLFGMPSNALYVEMWIIEVLYYGMAISQPVWLPIAREADPKWGIINNWFLIFACKYTKKNSSLSDIGRKVAFQMLISATYLLLCIYMNC